MWVNGLSLFFYAYPVYWVLGLDGFLWMAFLPFFLIIQYPKWNYKLDKHGIFFIVGAVIFTFGAAISATNISEKLRYLTWFRDYYLILTMFIIVYIIGNNKWRVVQENLNKSLLFLMIFSCVVGLISLLINQSVFFHSFFYHVLPESIRATDFGGRLVLKNTATEGYIAGYYYLRISSTFDYATSYALVLVATTLYFCTNASVSRNYKMVYLFLALTNLLFTTARTSIFALIVGFIIYIFLSREYYIKSLIVFLSLITVFLILTFGIDALHGLSTLRGGGSFNDRIEIYTRTFKAIIENPFGYGSQTDVADLEYPLGSHSTWLGIIYKYGLIGFFGLLIMVLSFLNPNGINGQKTDKAQYWSIIISILIISILEEIYLDAMAAIIVSAVIGMSMSRVQRRI